MLTDANGCDNYDDDDDDKMMNKRKACTEEESGFFKTQRKGLNIKKRKKEKRS